MIKSETTSILASFATLKELNDAKKYTNSYQLLSEFIHYIIKVKAVLSFSSIEMKHYLADVFEFDVPEAVVGTASIALPFIYRRNHRYNVDKSKFTANDTFEDTKAHAEGIKERILEPLSAYIREKLPHKEISNHILMQALIAFLVDDHQNGNGRYAPLISEFILKHENNKEIQDALKIIQEGSILYIGLNHNINETGSITRKLTLFLDTEIIFGLVGYNGEIHKQLALDFFTQVKKANSKETKIELRYFHETKQEMDSFFSGAALIVDGKNQLIDTVAMKTIVNQCKTSSDVLVKQSDFYHALKYQFGILEDEKDDYYAEHYNAYNLESFETANDQDQSSWMFISHINKLRKGRLAPNSIESEFLLVTNTKNTLNASQKQTTIDQATHNLERVSDYAVSLNRITNILWYKLGNGFGQNNYPNNVNAALKARVILASTISHNLTLVYNQAKNQYKNGELTEDQLISRILVLHKKPTLPEELDGDSIDDSMDFSDEYLSHYEEEVKKNKIALEQKVQEFEDFKKAQTSKIEEKEKTIAEAYRLLQESSDEKAKLTSELDAYRKKEQQSKAKKANQKRRLILIVNICWKAILVLGIAAIAIWCEKTFESKWPAYISAAVDLLAVLISIWSVVKKDIAKYSSNKNH